MKNILLAILFMIPVPAMAKEFIDYSRITPHFPPGVFRRASARYSLPNIKHYSSNTCWFYRSSLQKRQIPPSNTTESIFEDSSIILRPIRGRQF
ncbi:MAG: hypothetical protein NTZ78_03340 [Candidatus Aureabacteria bacterium]|nr:hypothetical protein [Candidatus Auribacterota bacterium]